MEKTHIVMLVYLILSGTQERRQYWISLYDIFPCHFIQLIVGLIQPTSHLISPLLGKLEENLSFVDARNLNKMLFQFCGP